MDLTQWLSGATLVLTAWALREIVSIKERLGPAGSGKLDDHERRIIELEKRPHR